MHAQAQQARKQKRRQKWLCSNSSCTKPCKTKKPWCNNSSSSRRAPAHLPHQQQQQQQQQQPTPPPRPLKVKRHHARFIPQKISRCSTAEPLAWCSTAYHGQKHASPTCHSHKPRQHNSKSNSASEKKSSAEAMPQRRKSKRCNHNCCRTGWSKHSKSCAQQQSPWMLTPSPTR